MSVGFGLGLSGGSDKLVKLPLLSSLGGKVRGGVTFTRASGQWYQNDSGVWQYAANGVPAFNSKGILLEPASTNKCTCYGVIPADTLGVELVAAANDRTLSVDTGWWTRTNCTISGGVATITAGTGTLERAGILTLGRVYEATFTVGGYTGGVVGISSGSTTNGSYVTANGTYTRRFIADQTNVFRLVSTAAGVTFDDVSLKEVQYAVGTKSYYTGGTWVQNHTNISLSGDQAAVLSTVDDSAALLGAGYQNIASSGKVYKLDNSLGVGAAFVHISGAAGNANNHSFNLLTKCAANSGNTVVRLSVTLTSSVNVPVGGYQITKAENKPAVATDIFSVRVQQGEVVYFLLPQLEEMAFSTSPMPTAGATATRATTNFTFPVAGNTKSNDFTVCGVVEFAAVSPNAFPQVFVANGAGGTSVAVQMSTASMSFYAQRILPGPVYKTTGANVVAIGQQLRFAAVYSSTGIRFFLNGVHQAPANADGTAVDLTGTIAITSASSIKKLRNLRIYRRALSEAQCIALTT